MGCETSRNVSVIDNPRQQRPSQQLRFTFTDLQLDVIRSTWPIMCRDIVAHGERLLLEVFSTEPAIKQLFYSFRSLEGESLKKSPLLEQHSSRFMDAIQITIEKLEDPHLNPSEDLMMLGAKHALIPGFDVTYFSIFTKCMHKTWEGVLGEEYTEDVQEVWNLIFEYIVQRIQDGYLLYHEDKAKDKPRLETISEVPTPGILTPEPPRDFTSIKDTQELNREQQLTPVS